MAPRGRFGARSRRSELLALILGLASGLVMLLAAAEIRSRPEWTGKLALDEAARELARAVEGEWEELQRSPGFRSRTDLGAKLDVDWLKQVRRLTGPAGGRIGPEPPTDPDAIAAFDALIVEARHQELEQKDLERAIEAILSALELEVDPARRARGRLRAVQLGLRAERAELVREQWTAVRTETEAGGSALAERGLTDEISFALLTGLAVAEVFEGEERAELGRQLWLWWWEGDIGVVDGATIRRDARGVLEAEIKPELTVLLGNVQALTGLESYDLKERIVGRARLEAFVRWIEAGGDSPEERLRPRESGPDFFARGDDLLVIPTDPTTCFFHSAPLLRTQFRERLTSLASFGRGFHVDLTGEETALGEEVRPWSELAGGHLGFSLRHEDPAAFIESEERRLGFLQLALVVMGLFTLLAGVVSFGGLRRQRRLQELKTGFIARVSHELRTPVTGILLATEGLVEGRARTPERQERYFGLIQGEARRLERLVANVLDFSRLDRGKGPRLDLATVDAAELAKELENLVEERCAAAEPSFSSHVKIEGGELQADVEAVRRTLVNLVDNALTHAGASRIGFEAETEGDELLLAFTDDGCGIPPHLRERIFEPFRQEPAVEDRPEGAGGAGLGLAIVREIVHGHGGRITCDAGTDGVGCRFELRLPLGSASSEAIER